MACNYKLRTLGVLLAGAGIGATVALLYAPNTGKQTRKKLLRDAKKTSNRLEDLQDGIRSYVTEWVDDASETISAGVASGAQSAKEGGDRLMSALGNAKNYLDDSALRVERYVKSLAS